MTYNFDHMLDRTSSYSSKWFGPKEEFGRDDLIPLWVADMDFQVPEEVSREIIERAGHQIFGYTITPDSYYDAVINWYKDIHQWTIAREEIVFTPGVVPGLNMIIRTFTKPGDEIIIQTPVYHQFQNVIKNTGRQLVENPLILESGNYRMDFENLRDVITAKTKMIILCNPHNPVGRSWKDEELKELGKIALDNNLLVVSDEIHGDLVFKPNRHRVFTELDKNFEKNTIVCTAPNKTFNIAGLKTANIIVKNKELRELFQLELEKHSMSGGTIFGMIAQEAAYNHGRDWYRQVLAYIESNIDFALDYIGKNIPRIKVKKPEATYLLWLDCRDLGLDRQELKDFFIDDCGVILNEGAAFGSDYSGYQRLNLATSRANLEEALRRIEEEVNKL